MHSSKAQMHIAHKPNYFQLVFVRATAIHSVLAMAWASIHPSVCLSVWHTLEPYQNGAS